MKEMENKACEEFLETEHDTLNLIKEVENSDKILE